jgi:hypothetical protein
MRCFCILPNQLVLVRPSNKVCIGIGLRDMRCRNGLVWNIVYVYQLLR